MATFHVLSRDGVRLAVHHHPGAGGSPVLCCHGLAANAVAFDLAPGASLAEALARAGHEVFLLELRGHGQSERPRGSWSFDSYLRQDLPAAIDEVRRRTGAEHVGFVGHSMGGLLGLAHLAVGGEGIGSLVTVGSSLDYSGGSGFRRLLPLRPLLHRLPRVPVGVLARASAPLVGRWASPYERFNVWPSNVDPAHWRAICRRGFHPVPPAVMTELATALEPGGLRSADGDEPYLGRLAGHPTPVRLLAGDRDAQCPPAAVTRTRDAIGASAEVLSFGRAHGCVDHYGHFDLLVGRRVEEEVFPHVLAAFTP